MRGGQRISVAAFAVAGLSTGLLGADQGGFFPRTWPWAALAFAAVGALAILSSAELRTPRAAVALICGLALLAVWTTCSALWSTEPQASLREAALTPVYVSAALALTALAAAAGATPILLGLAAGATGTAVYSLTDRLLHGPHLADQQASLLVRPLGYANALGALCAIALVVILAFALGARRRAEALVAGLVAVPLGVALALTGSRGSWLAGAVGLAVAAVLMARGRRWATATAAIGGLALTTLYVLTAFTIPVGLQARGDYWHVAWHVAGNHPLLGTGAGTYDLAWAAFGDLGRWSQALDAHSLYLESFAELGVIGLVLVLALVAPLVSGLRAERPSTALAASLGGATTFLLHAGLDWDWEMPAVTIAGIACLAATLGASEPQLRVGPRLRIAALSIAVATIAAYSVLLVVRAT